MLPHPIDIKPQSTQCPTPCRHYAPIILVSPQPKHIMPQSSECPPHLIRQASIAIESQHPVRRPRWSVSSQYTSGLITTVSPHSVHIPRSLHCPYIQYASCLNHRAPIITLFPHSVHIMPQLLVSSHYTSGLNHHSVHTPSTHHSPIITSSPHPEYIMPQ